MTLGSLFAGIGGFELAAQRAGITPLWSNEIDPFCCQVLRKNFKHKIIEADIRTIGKHNLEAVDIISGGFPCQPFSVSGFRKGKADERYLWPEMLRVIDEVKPAYVIAENVSGVSFLVDEICTGLEALGYKVEPVSIEACALGADHIRERYWFCAYRNGLERKSIFSDFGSFQETFAHPTRDWEKGTGWHKEADELDTLGSTFLQFEQRYGQPAVFGDYDGLPKKLDVTRRIGAVGNAIVPQIAYVIFECFKQIEG